MISFRARVDRTSVAGTCDANRLAARAKRETRKTGISCRETSILSPHPQPTRKSNKSNANYCVSASASREAFNTHICCCLALAASYVNAPRAAGIACHGSCRWSLTDANAAGARLRRHRSCCRCRPAATGRGIFARMRPKSRRAESAARLEEQ